MEFIYFLNFVISLCIFLFIVIKFIKNHNVAVIPVMKNFLFMGILQLANSILFFMWTFNFLNASIVDYSVYLSILLMGQVLVLFRITYLFSRNKKLNYLLGLYLFSIPFLFLVFHMSSVFFFMLSNLFGILIFVDFVIRDDAYRKVGYVGVFYFGISLICSVFLYFNLSMIYWMSFILNLVFFVFVYFFIFDLNKFAILPFKKREDRAYFWILLEHLIFIVTITNFVFIGTIGLHEFGHFGVSNLYGCEYNKIVYDGDLFHTETLCSDESSVPYVVLGGILIPLIFALVLYFAGGKFMKEIGVLMGGFNLIAISRDLGELQVSLNLILLSIFFGIALVIYGIFLLAKSKVDIEIYENVNDVNILEEKNILNIKKEGGQKSRK